MSGNSNQIEIWTELIKSALQALHYKVDDTNNYVVVESMALSIYKGVEYINSMSICPDAVFITTLGLGRIEIELPDIADPKVNPEDTVNDIVRTVTRKHKFHATFNTLGTGRRHAYQRR